MSRTPTAAGGFAEPYARYRRSAHVPPPHRSWAIESAVGDLERALCRDRCHAVVEAPPGHTRTLLLRALAERLGSSYRVVHVPAGLRDGEVCPRILAALGESPGRDAEVRLLSVLYEIGSRGSALVVLIDDAGTLSAAALRRLGRLASISRPDLRLALVVAAGPGSDTVGRVVAALGVGAEKVTLTPLSSSREKEAPRPSAARADEPAPRAARAVASPPVRRVFTPSPARPIRVPRRRARARSGRSRRSAALLLAAAALLGLQQISGPTPPDRVDGPRAEPQIASEGAVSAPASESTSTAAPAATPGPVEAVRVPTRPDEAVAASPAPAETLPAPAPEPIAVSLNARPWARIEVDGRDLGITPLADVPIAPGTHRFRAHLADGRVIERTARVDAYRDRIVFP